MTRAIYLHLSYVYRNVVLFKLILGEKVEVVVLVTRDIYLGGAVICGSSVEALTWSRVVSRLVGD